MSRDNPQGGTLFGVAACGFVTAAAPDRLAQGDVKGCVGPQRPWGSTTSHRECMSRQGRYLSLSPEERVFCIMQLITLMVPPALPKGSRLRLGFAGSWLRVQRDEGRCWRWCFFPANKAVPVHSC